MTVVSNVVVVIINDKYTHKQARNIKHVWIFLTAITVYIRGLSQIYAQTKEKHETYFSILLFVHFYVQCIVAHSYLICRVFFTVNIYWHMAGNVGI